MLHMKYSRKLLRRVLLQCSGIRYKGVQYSSVHQQGLHRQEHWSSQRVRSTFLEYFKSCGHHHVRSSPVVPWNDPSLDFVNAGMNQFKSVFLGEDNVPFTRATSSQRCIRVGGKHNDLAEVGRDTYHHTFFEMLGSWSFGDYFKEEACTMAWKLLTEIYGLHPSRLYVTYFGGDAAMGLPPDLEVKNIWLNIGVPEERIIPFGLKDNFWEMGSVGPCGPCTEIHYDHLHRPLAPHRVNIGVPDMVELWNIVFIQYERVEGGGLRDLGRSYVDTGMGLERITAVLNNTTSNYDTDLFTPLFSTIQKMSGCTSYGGRLSSDGRCLDTAYRTLADHARMVTVALADGAFPQQCYALYKILRRSLTIGNKHFNLGRRRELSELAEVVLETLSPSHPELLHHTDTITTIINHEEQAYYDMKDSLHKDWMKLLKKRPELAAMSDYTTPRILEGVAEIAPHIDVWRKLDNKLPGDVAFNLFRTYGIHADIIHDLAGVYGLTVDENEFHNAIDTYNTTTKNKIKMNSEKRMLTTEKELIDNLKGAGIPPTDDSAKYAYVYESGAYQFPALETKVVALLADSNTVEERERKSYDYQAIVEERERKNYDYQPSAIVEQVRGRAKVGVFLDRTNFYHEAGGQDSDTGSLTTGSATVDVESVERVGGYVIHWGTLTCGVLMTGEAVTASVCQERRTGCMRHHTATHLINATVKSIMGVCRQTSSRVTEKDCHLQLQTYQSITPDIVYKVQETIKKWIDAKSPVTRTSVPFQDLVVEPRTTLIPGEVYPLNVHVISTSLDDGNGASRDGFGTSLDDGIGTSLDNETTASLDDGNSAGRDGNGAGLDGTTAGRLASLEPCCGTHLHNTAHIQDFVIQDVSAARKNCSNIRALCGEAARVTEINGDTALEYLEAWQGNVNDGQHDRVIAADIELEAWWKKNQDLSLPYTVRCRFTQALDNIANRKKNDTRVNANAEMRNEVQEILNHHKTGPIVHLLRTNFGSSRPRLVQGHKLGRDRAMLLLARTADVVVGRAALPQELTVGGASAQEWLECVRLILGGKVETPPEYQPAQLSNFRSSSLENISQDKLDEALTASRHYINRFL